MHFLTKKRWNGIMQSVNLIVKVQKVKKKQKTKMKKSITMTKKIQKKKRRIRKKKKSQKNKNKNNPSNSNSNVVFLSTDSVMDHKFVSYQVKMNSNLLRTLHKIYLIVLQ